MPTLTYALPRDPCCARACPRRRYSVELATQRVWDYAGDGYVHRLVQNLGDGKPVEFGDPMAVRGGAGARSGAGGAGATGAGTAAGVQRSQVPPVTDLLAAQRMDGKVSTLLREYNTLLASQLDTQRQFYENALVRVADPPAALRVAEHCGRDDTWHDVRCPTTRLPTGTCPPRPTRPHPYPGPCRRVAARSAK